MADNEGKAEFEHSSFLGKEATSLSAYVTNDDVTSEFATCVPIVLRVVAAPIDVSARLLSTHSAPIREVGEVQFTFENHSDEPVTFTPYYEVTGGRVTGVHTRDQPSGWQSIVLSPREVLNATVYVYLEAAIVDVRVIAVPNGDLNRSNGVFTAQLVASDAPESVDLQLTLIQSGAKRAALLLTNKGASVARHIDLDTQPAVVTSDFSGDALAPGETRLIELVASENATVSVAVSSSGAEADPSDNRVEVDFSRRRRLVRRG